MTKTLTISLSFMGILFFLLPLKAQQDPMFTKYMFNSQVFNPGYAGSKDYISLNVLYREQWWGLNQAGSNGKSYKYSPTTQTFTLQYPTGKRVSLGLSAINDRIGATNSTTLNLVYAYHFPFLKGELSVGLQAGMMNWRADWSRLTFKDPQANDYVYAENPNRFLPNVGMGLYYFSEKFYAGFSVPHIIEGELRAYNDNDIITGQNIDKFYRHYYFTTGAAIELAGKNLVFKPSLLIKNVGFLSDFAIDQQTFTSIGAPTEFDIDVSLLFYESFWIGAAYRSALRKKQSSHDSADIWVAFYLGNGLRLGAAYDFTLSALQRSTSGTFELMLGYDFDYKVKKVATPRYF